MAAPDMQTAGLQNVFLPALLQSFLSEICSRAVLALAQSTCFLEDSSSNSMITCVHHPAETRSSDISSKLIEEYTTRRVDSNIDEENDLSEKCRVNILYKGAAPQMADRVPRQHFSEWLLVAKNKEDEDEDDDEEDEDDEDEDDEEGDEEEGDDDEDGGDAEGGEGDGDEDEEDDEADDDDEDEEEEDDDEDDDEDEESPPKKLRK